jgi:hypothetical protein
MVSMFLLEDRKFGCRAHSVRGLYGYRSQGADELSVTVGELIELSSGPSGGQNYGDDWWEGIYAIYSVIVDLVSPKADRESGIDKTGQKGIFPSNYVGS